MFCTCYKNAVKVFHIYVGKFYHNFVDKVVPQCYLTP